MSSLLLGSPSASSSTTHPRLETCSTEMDWKEPIAAEGSPQTKLASFTKSHPWTRSTRTTNPRTCELFHKPRNHRIPRCDQPIHVVRQVVSACDGYLGPDVACPVLRTGRHRVSSFQFPSGVLLLLGRHSEESPTTASSRAATNLARSVPKSRVGFGGRGLSCTALQCTSASTFPSCPFASAFASRPTLAENDTLTARPHANWRSPRCESFDLRSRSASS